MEAVLSDDENKLTFSPIYEYEYEYEYEFDFDFESNHINNSFRIFRPIIAQQNSGIVQNVVFCYDPKKSSRSENLPKDFKLKSNKLYTIHLRFYISKNGFFSSENNEEVIQVLYGFETSEETDNEKVIITNQVWF